MEHDVNQACMLLMDTCGDGAGVAISVGDKVVATATLSRSGASSEIVGAIHRVFAETGCAPRELEAIAVVSGPGSFTGVRVGMSAAKGLAEALQIKMVTVSRLEVLAVAARIKDGWVVLDAGRSGFYAMPVNDGRYGAERLLDLDSLRASAIDDVVVVAEERVAVLLQERAVELTVLLRPLSIDDAFTPSMSASRDNTNVMALADANYLLHESNIYKAKSSD